MMIILKIIYIHIYIEDLGIFCYSKTEKNKEKSILGWIWK